jgi:hypothetical protein
MRSPRPEFVESVRPAAVFGNVNMLFAPPAVLDGGGVLGGAVVGLFVATGGRPVVAGLAVSADFEERAAKTTAPVTPPITTRTASTISTIVVVERPLLAGAVYAYGAVP